MRDAGDRRVQSQYPKFTRLNEGSVQVRLCDAYNSFSAILEFPHADGIGQPPVTARLMASSLSKDTWPPLELFVNGELETIAADLTSSSSESIWIQRNRET